MKQKASNKAFGAFCLKDRMLPKDTKDEFGMCFFIKFADQIQGHRPYKAFRITLTRKPTALA